MQGRVHPLVKLEKVEVASGEENEDVLFEAKSKSYRFLEGEWKERGLGPIKLLKDKDSGKIRVLMRREKTLKICANFHVKPGTKIEEHTGGAERAARVRRHGLLGQREAHHGQHVRQVRERGEGGGVPGGVREGDLEHMKQFEGVESEEKKEGDEAADALADELAKTETKDEEKKETEA